VVGIAGGGIIVDGEGPVEMTDLPEQTLFYGAVHADGGLLLGRTIYVHRGGDLLADLRFEGVVPQENAQDHQGHSHLGNEPLFQVHVLQGHTSFGSV